jgi:uncharacterized protein involved in high-affinity Fe2+ transport
LFSCEYGDDKELKTLTEITEYMKTQIEQINKKEFAPKVQAALKEDGIEMSQNITMDIKIGNGTETLHIL